jgi:hypothetical protein
MQVSAQFLASAAGSGHSLGPSPLTKPPIISGTQDMREIDWNLL